MGRPIPTVSLSSPATAAFPIRVRGRRPHWSFRGLLNVHSRYGLSARCIAKATHLSRRLRRFRYLHRRSDSYRLERPSCRVGIAPTEDQHLFTAHTRSDPKPPPVDAARPVPRSALSSVSARRDPWRPQRVLLQPGRARKPETGTDPVKPLSRSPISACASLQACPGMNGRSATR